MLRVNPKLSLKKRKKNLLNSEKLEYDIKIDYEFWVSSKKKIDFSREEKYSNFLRLNMCRIKFKLTLKINMKIICYT